MAKNEKQFRSRFIKCFGKNSLAGKVRWPSKAARKEVTITTDESISVGQNTILIEIDSGNAAKLLIGQYVLLSAFCGANRDRTIFVVVHYYKGYNAERTRKNLQYISDNVLRKGALPFVILGKQEFWELCKSVKTVKELSRELTHRSTGRAKAARR